MHTRSTRFLLLAVALAFVPLPHARARSASRMVWVLTKDGRSLEGALPEERFAINLNGPKGRSQMPLSLREIRSFSSADPASPEEAALITRCLATVRGKDLKAGEQAAEQLATLGLPALSPLLASYQDTDAHEPDLLYRLFARIIPGQADAMDRTQDLVRLAKGGTLRGKLTCGALKLTLADGKTETLPAGAVRRLAVRQPSLERTFDLQALHHCTYVGWLDTGLAVTPETRVQADSAGFVRLSYDEDGWACDPDGIADPLPGKRRMQEGFRWGAVLGRVGAGGSRWLAGKHVEKTDLPAGRLYFVVNDNEHWQNNIGSYRVRLRVTNAYDLGEPQ